MKDIVRIITILSSCGYSFVNAALTNVALGKPAYQIDTNTTYVAGNAVDGNTNGNLSAGSCTHTATIEGVWWAVDLGQTYRIDHVTIFNRMDCCGEFLRNVKVWTGYDGSTDYDYAASKSIIGSSYTFRMGCRRWARWVKITRGVDEGPLSLCEVQVFGDLGKGPLLEYLPGQIGTGRLYISTPARSIFQCCLSCLKTSCCFAVNYNPDEQNCDQLRTTNTTTGSNSTIQFWKFP